MESTSPISTLAQSHSLHPADPTVVFSIRGDSSRSGLPACSAGLYARDVPAIRDPATFNSGYRQGGLLTTLTMPAKNQRKLWHVYVMRRFIKGRALEISVNKMTLIAEQHPSRNLLETGGVASGAVECECGTT